MRRVVRPLCVLMLLQGVCLAAGLLIHDRFLVSTALWGQESAESGAAQNAPPVPEETARLFAAMPAASTMAFLWTIGLQSAIAYFLLARMQGEHSRRQSKSDEQSLQHTRDLLRTRDAVIFGLAKLAESRDPETGHHLERISLYSTRLASAVSRDPKYSRVVTPGFVRLIGISSALHDIGKVALEDSVLLKPGELTSNERFRMQLHVEVGAESIREIERRLGTSNFLEMAREIANSHHERWDGTGYPAGLAGEQIPLAARIVAIADVYDALSARRVYKEAFPHSECVEIIRKEAGTQFDPELVRIFLDAAPQFEEIARRFEDECESASAANGATESEGSTGRRLTREQEQTLLAALANCEESYVVGPPSHQ
ncbi:MAG TPA: HD domain-containing phosphohydrolase [Planctomycetaceae bacterium]|jgi:HD-GYP domain-containing protein (c-di-GMP phosphodiesterase class II)|nr:HD domain-containing phosphohydrolase [Planctomycetaceae bacterium]